jgi:type II secretory pathway pseudopilin PulG
MGLSAERRKPSRRKTAGFTLLELVIAVLLFFILGSLIIWVSLTGQNLAREEALIFDSRSTLHRLSQLIARDLRESSREKITLYGNGVQYSLIEGVSTSGQVQWSGPITIYYSGLAIGETANGSDDNGDGLVDEFVLMRYDGGSGKSVPLGTGLSTFRLSWIGARSLRLEMGSKKEILRSSSPDIVTENLEQVITVRN